MRLAVFSTKPWTRKSFDAVNADFDFALTYHEAKLEASTAPLAKEHDAVCIFVNDIADQPALQALAEHGVGVVALRCAGFNNVDLHAARDLGIDVVRVPAYSPYAVAEHALALLLSVNRKIHRAYARVRDGNFALDGLLGFDMHGKTAGVIGTGKIGAIVCGLLRGFGCRVLAYDKYPKEDLREAGVAYVELDTLYRESDVLSLHCPLTHETYHMINGMALAAMKPGVVIVNTSRGALIDTTAVIQGLKDHRVGALALDVYEEESDLFFEDLSDEVIQDDTFARLLTFPNVLVTGHQAFFTSEAVRNIGETTFTNLRQVEAGEECPNRVAAKTHIATV